MPFDAPVTMATLPLSLRELVDMIFHFRAYSKNVHRSTSVTKDSVRTFRVNVPYGLTCCHFSGCRRKNEAFTNLSQQRGGRNSSCGSGLESLGKSPRGGFAGGVSGREIDFVSTD
jgi:hypothetical protein